MKKLVILFTTLLTSLTAYCQHPFKQTLDSIATITFPDTPEIKKTETGNIFLVKYYNTIYLAQATPLTTSLRDLLEKNGTDTIYRSFIGGVIETSKGRIFYKKDTTINKINGVEFGYMGIAKGKTYYNYQQIFYLNEVLIDFSVLTTDSLKKDDEKITSFFNTFKLTIADSEIRQNISSNVAYHLGHLIGKLLFWIILISIIGLLGYGIIFIIKKIFMK